MSATNEKIKIIDNAISPDFFVRLKNEILNYEFPWYFNSTKSLTSEEIKNLSKEQIDFYSQNPDKVYDYQFTHLFYNDNRPYSNKFELVEPILSLLPLISLIRIKANLTLHYQSIEKFGLHTDVNVENSELYPNLFTALFYLNTNDGYTYFEDGTTIESKENRLVIFPNYLKHGATTTTNKYRSVINFNFVGTI